MWMAVHQPIIISFELLMIAIIGHRAWLLPFHWRLRAADPSIPDKPANRLVSSASISTGSIEEVEKLMNDISDGVSMSGQQIIDLFHGHRTLKEVAPYLAATHAPHGTSRGPLRKR